MEFLKTKQHRYTLINSDKTVKNASRNNQKVEFKFLENTGEAILYVYSSLLKKNNYSLTLKGTSLTVIISERREIVKPTYIEVINKTVHDKLTYERLKSYKYELPNSNFRIDKTYWNSNKRRVEVYFTCHKKRS